MTEIEQRLFDLMNVQRHRNRLRPLVEAPTLTIAARRHSEDMLRRRFFPWGTLSMDGVAGQPARSRRLPLLTSLEATADRRQFLTEPRRGYPEGTPITPLAVCSNRRMSIARLSAPSRIAVMFGVILNKPKKRRVSRRSSSS